LQQQEQQQQEEKWRSSMYMELLFDVRSASSQTEAN
jgi:hypothetical protein